MDKRFILLLILFGLVLNFTFISAGELRVTEEHPFLINGSWIDASQLKIGDELTLVNGSKVKITKLTDVVSNKSFKVYNLEAGDYHNFVVGKEGVVVHNSNNFQYKNILGDPFTPLGVGEQNELLKRFIGIADANPRFTSVEKIYARFPDLLKFKMRSIKNLESRAKFDELLRRIFVEKNNRLYLHNELVGDFGVSGAFSPEHRLMLLSGRSDIESLLSQKLDTLLHESYHASGKLRNINLDGKRVFYSPKKGEFIPVSSAEIETSGVIQELEIINPNLIGLEEVNAWVVGAWGHRALGNGPPLFSSTELKSVLSRLEGERSLYAKQGSLFGIFKTSPVGYNNLNQQMRGRLPDINLLMESF